MAPALDSWRRRASFLCAVAALGLGGLSGCRPRTVAPPPAAVVPPFVPPLAAVEAGEQLVMHRGATEFHYTITAVTDEEVVADCLTYQGGVLAGERVELHWPRNGLALQPGGVLTSLRHTTVDIDGRSWPCWLAEVRSTTGQFFYYWLSDSVAAQGFLKIARFDDGKLDEATAITRVSDSSAR